MKKYIVWIFLFCFVSNISFSQTITGLWVARRVDEREDGKDARFTMEMLLVDKQNRQRKRKLTILRKDFGGVDKLLLRFTYPNDIKGTSFLVWEHRGRDNERFLYLPAIGRVRRIATSEKEENFVGTDFSYEDISGRKLEDYTYELVKEEVTLDEHPCYLLASYPEDRSSRYIKILSWVRKDNFVTIRAEYYNKKGELEKTFEVQDLQEIDGIWTPMNLFMENHKTNHKTFIKITNVRYNTGIPAAKFEKRELMK